MWNRKGSGNISRAQRGDFDQKWKKRAEGNHANAMMKST